MEADNNTAPFAFVNGEFVERKRPERLQVSFTDYAGTGVATTANTLIIPNATNAVKSQIFSLGANAINKHCGRGLVPLS